MDVGESTEENFIFTTGINGYKPAQQLTLPGDIKEAALW